MINPKYYILIAIIAASFGAGYKVTDLYWSARYGSLITDLKEQELENANNVIALERENAEKLRLSEVKLVEANAKREVKNTIITKEVIKYVEVNSNSSCVLDDDWVHISNAAAPLPRVPETTAPTDGGAGEVHNLGDALEVMVHNYNVCQVAVDRLKGWREWYTSVSEANQSF